MFFRFKTRSGAPLYYSPSEYFIWRNCAKLQKMGWPKPDVTRNIGQGPDQNLWFLNEYGQP